MSDLIQHVSDANFEKDVLTTGEVAKICSVAPRSSAT